MLSSKDGKPVHWRDLNYWDYLAMVAGTITLIAALGEWAFHWWDQPGDVVSVVGFVLTLILAGFAASKRDVRGLGNDLRTEIRAFRTEAREGQAKLVEGQARQTELLEQMVAFFRPRS